jgi:DNA processing protein
MITARLGRKFQKPVWALPGEVGRSVAEGVNSLIKKGEAKMVTRVEDLLESLGVGKAQLSLLGTDEADPVMEILSEGPREADELAGILNMPIDVLMRKLSMYCLLGELEECEGKYKKI